MARKACAVSLCFVLACLTLSSVTGARARPPVESSYLVPIAEAGPTLAPFQHVRFCLRYPADCKSDPTEIAVIELDVDTLELMNRVNHSVNATIAPQLKSDGTSSGLGWTIAPSAGDCNDYAVTKRHELLQSGLPAKALRLAVVRTSSGIGHLVLVVTTTKGELVLDNLTETIRPWQTTDYRWLKIQSASDARFWYDVRMPVAERAEADRKLRLAGR
jgi:predicted transglutaminase-like cysteine proteinase